VRRCSRAGGGRWKPGIRPFSLVSLSTTWERGIGRATHGAEKADCARSGPMRETEHAAASATIASTPERPSLGLLPRRRQKRSEH
jgi:hypothetical protein